VAWTDGGGELAKATLVDGGAPTAGAAPTAAPALSSPIPAAVLAATARLLTAATAAATDPDRGATPGRVVVARVGAPAPAEAAAWAELLARRVVGAASVVVVAASLDAPARVATAGATTADAGGAPLLVGEPAPSSPPAPPSCSRPPPPERAAAPWPTARATWLGTPRWRGWAARAPPAL
jgi:hypothetical protein